MKINEIAKKLNISPRAIRFYEEKGLISPQKQQDNQYRLFTEKDAWRLQMIISLREVGMPIEEIGNVLEEVDQGDPNEVLYYLEVQRSVMFSQWAELKQMIDTTDRMIQLLKQNQKLVAEDMYLLADGSKRLRDRRNHWQDRWNFDHLAPSFDDMVGKSDHGSKFNTYANYTEALDLIYQWIDAQKGEYGLDVGTGTGNLAGRFLESGIRMSGIDQSREMLKQCRHKYPEMDTKLGNMLTIPYMDAQFDFVSSSFALHHLTDEQKRIGLSEMMRTLKPHGRICIADLMFNNEQAREDYIQNLIQHRQVSELKAIQDKYYSDRSGLLEWFDEHGYVTKHRQINDLLHIVYAVPIRK
jgi:putative AdoMet-dependent methyltransferase